MSPEAKPDPASAPFPWLGKPIALLAGRLKQSAFPTGDHALLRRMSPLNPGRAVLPLYRLLHEAEIKSTEGEIGRWALIVHCLALVRGDHDYTVRTGAALQEMGYSEARLNQLLAADFDLLVDLLPLLARRVASQRVSLNWLTLAELALWAGREETKADEARLRLARHYVQADAKAA
jgi:CRISPR system Cascade subunit CasB